jgi:hypothetical protein
VYRLARVEVDLGRQQPKRRPAQSLLVDHWTGADAASFGALDRARLASGSAFRTPGRRASPDVSGGSAMLLRDDAAVGRARIRWLRLSRLG